MSARYLRRNKQQAIKLQTVNVVEIANGEFQGLRSFTDNPRGNKRAERLFRRLIEKYEKPLSKDVPRSDEEDFENYLDDGIYDVFRPRFILILTHSL